MTANFVIVGGGPAGLMAAQVLAEALPRREHAIHVYDAMPSVGRKFLLAGRGGLNLTHAQAQDGFLAQYGAAREVLAGMLNAFGASQVRAWAHALGIETFVGSSQRVFPQEMKAAPLLRAWLQHLRQAGVQVHTRHRWSDWRRAAHGKGLELQLHKQGEPAFWVPADACLLALGGASWPRLGSDGGWTGIFSARGIGLAPLQAANCGFDRQGGWSEHLRSRFAGQAIKSVRLRHTDAQGQCFDQQGEFVLTETGIEGSLVYAASRAIRDDIAARASATVWLDLALNRSQEQVQTILETRRSSRTLSNHLQKALSLSPLACALLYEVLGRGANTSAGQLAALIKALPITLVAPRPIAEAISTAGGVAFASMNEDLMLRQEPGIFCAGEMLDWEAPTGGYLLTACLSSGRAAALGMLRYTGTV